MRRIETKHVRVIICEGARTDRDNLPIPPGEYDCEIAVVVTTVGRTHVSGRPSYYISLNGVRTLINRAIPKGQVSEVPNHPDALGRLYRRR